MSKTQLMAGAIAAYDAARTSDNPDWRAVAELLRAALPERRRAAARSDGLTDIADYESKSRASRVGPTMVLTFEDDRMVRATFSTDEGKAINAGRGLRVACSFYRTKVAHPIVDTAAMKGIAIPPIRSAHVERDGNVIAIYDPAECNAYVAPFAGGMPVARWKRRRNAAVLWRYHRFVEHLRDKAKWAAFDAAMAEEQSTRLAA